MSERTLPIRRAHIRVVADGAEVLLYDQATSTSHLLNPTAFAIWQLCDGDTTADEMVAGVCELFDVTRAEAADDIAHVLSELQSVGLLGRRSPVGG